MRVGGNKRMEKLLSLIAIHPSMQSTHSESLLLIRPVLMGACRQVLNLQSASLGACVFMYLEGREGESAFSLAVDWPVHAYFTPALPWPSDLVGFRSICWLCVVVGGCGTFDRGGGGGVEGHRHRVQCTTIYRERFAKYSEYWFANSPWERSGCHCHHQFINSISIERDGGLVSDRLLDGMDGQQRAIRVKPCVRSERTNCARLYCKSIDCAEAGKIFYVRPGEGYYLRM